MALVFSDNCHKLLSKMDGNDLFSFDPSNGNEDQFLTMNEEVLEAFYDGPTLTGRKRKASTALQKTSLTVHSFVLEEIENQHEPMKKLRSISPEPLVLDKFQTEAKREVAAIAGLDNAFETGGGLELKHQVCVSKKNRRPSECTPKVRHQVAVPPGYNYIPISKHVPPAKPHREYKFELDPFQKVSIYAIQRNESVLVSAHTSAGKTVVAEYAIAQSLAKKQRVIYTSPIKVSRISIQS